MPKPLSQSLRRTPGVVDATFNLRECGYKSLMPVDRFRREEGMEIVDHPPEPAGRGQLLAAGSTGLASAGLLHGMDAPSTRTPDKPPRNADSARLSSGVRRSGRISGSTVRFGLPPRL